MPDDLELRRSLDRVLDDASPVADLDSPDDGPLSMDLPGDRTRRFTFTSFTRMRTEWPEADRTQLDQLRYLARLKIAELFPAAFRLREEIFMTVREALTVEGKIARGNDGQVQWRCDDDGVPIEDWTQFSDTMRQHYLHVITTHLLEWEIAAQELWLPAMVSKTQWRESFARGFMTMAGHEVSGKPTIDDRTQAGHLNSIDFEYFAIFQTYLSRMAEALVKSMIRVQVMLEKTYIR